MDLIGIRECVNLEQTLLNYFHVGKLLRARRPATTSAVAPGVSAWPIEIQIRAVGRTVSDAPHGFTEFWKSGVA